MFDARSQSSNNSDLPTRPTALDVGDQGPQPVAPAALMSALGDELGQGLTELQDGLQELYSTGKTNSTKVKAMLAAASHALRVAKTGQQIGRLLGGRLRQSHERLSLKDLVDDRLKAR